MRSENEPRLLLARVGDVFSRGDNISIILGCCFEASVRRVPRFFGHVGEAAQGNAANSGARSSSLDIAYRRGFFDKARDLWLVRLARRSMQRECNEMNARLFFRLLLFTDRKFARYVVGRATLGQNRFSMYRLPLGKPRYLRAFHRDAILSFHTSQ